MKSFFLFVRWPVAIGLIVALAVLAFMPGKVNIGFDSFTERFGQPSFKRTQWQQPVSYADAVDRASMAVVNIYTRKEVTQRIHPFFNDPIFRHLFNSADVPRQKRMQSALGSGVVATSEGHILTNYHVIAGADEIVVALEDGRNERAVLLGENRDRDLAVLKIDLKGLSPIPINENSQARVGDVVLAIGNPFGVGQTVTQGIISATGNRNRALNISLFEDFIQTDAAIHQGNSGGALIDVYGNIVGINTASLNETGFTGGIGFAIPIDIAMQTLNDITQFGRVVKGWLGVEALPLNPRRAHESGLQTSTGVVITSTTMGGPAEMAGLLRGDIIIGIEGTPVMAPNDIIQTIQESRPGQTITIEFIRAGRVATLDVVLVEKPEQLIRPEEAEA